MPCVYTVYIDYIVYIVVILCLYGLVRTYSVCSIEYRICIYLLGYCIMLRFLPSYSYSLVIIIIIIIITFVIFISFDTDECHADSAKANSMCMYHVLLYGQ